MNESVWSRRFLFLILSIALLYGSVAVIRYPSPWAEGDTSFFSRTIAGVIEYGTLEPDVNSHIYPQGFVYQSWAAAIVLLTGLPVDRYIEILSPLLGVVLLGVTALAAFSRMLNSPSNGFLAALTLFLIPEVVFAVLRGNHDKVTLSMTLAASLAVVMIILVRRRGERSWAWWTFFVIAVFTSAASNAYFGSLIVLALTVAAVALAIAAASLRGFARAVAPILLAVGTAAVLGWGVVTLVIFVVYQPAGDLLRIAPALLEGIRGLLDPSPAGAPGSVNPYTVIQRDWVSDRAYRLVSSFRWILFASSFAVWVVAGIQVLRSAVYRRPARILTLALYGVFGLLLGLAIPIDLIGLDVGSNLQVRVYVYFALFSAPLFAFGISRSIAAIGRPLPRATAIVATVALLTVFLGLGFMKAINDPLVSNTWRFYSPSEASAVRFFLERQPNRLHSLWIGPTSRLKDAFYVSHPTTAVELLRFDATGIANASAINLVAGSTATAPYALDSATIRNQIELLDVVPYPPASLGNAIYDSGQVVITHLAP